MISGPLGRNSLLIFVALRIGDLAMMAGKFFLGRFLPAVEFGAIDPFLSVLVILGLPVGILCQCAVKTISRLEAREETGKRAAFIRDILRLGALGSLLSCVLVIVLNPFIFSRLHLDSVVFLYIMVGLTALIMWWLPILNAILQGCQKYRIIAATSAMNPILLLLFTVVMVGVFHRGLHGALAARLWAGGLMGILVLLFVLPLLKGPKCSYGEEIHALKGTLVPMSIFLTSQTILFHFDRLFVRNFLLEESGGYAAVITLGQIPLWLIGPIILVLLPMASAEHALGRDLSRFVRQTLFMGGAITLGSTLFLGIIAGPVLQIWNAAFAPYAGYVWKYALAMGVEGMIQLVGNIEIARHQYKGFWWMGILTVVYCAVIYLFRSWMTIDILLILFLTVRIMILGGMVGIISIRSHRTWRGLRPCQVHL